MKPDKITPDMPQVLLPHVLRGAAGILLIHLLLAWFVKAIASQSEKCGLLTFSILLTVITIGYSIVAGWKQQPTQVRITRLFWTTLAVALVEASIALFADWSAGLGIFLANFLLAAYGFGLSFLTLRKLR